MKKFKRSFSTVAFYDFDCDEIIQIAKESGINGIEIRLDADNRIFGLEGEHVENAIAKFKENDIVVTNLGTSVCLKGYDAEAVKILEHCSVLAKKISTVGLRVFLGDFSRKRTYFTPSDYGGIVRTLKEAAKKVAENDSEIWIETHNEFSTADILTKLLDDVSCDNVKIIWDIIHPVEKGELPYYTATALKDRIAHVHIKDGVESVDANETDFTYTKLGQGVVPIEQVLESLEKIGYDGYLSLEWERLWRKEIKEIYDVSIDILNDYNDFLDNVERNIVPLVSDERWWEFAPDSKKLAYFSKNRYNTSLDIKLSSCSYGVGKWICDFNLLPDKTYKLTGSCVTDCAENDVYFLYTLFDENGDMIIRDHASSCSRSGDNLVFEEIIDAPCNTCKMRIEMWLKGNYASVKWLQPRLVECNPLPQRNVRVSVAYIAPDSKDVHTIKENTDVILNAIDKSAEYKPDLIVISEAMNSRETNVPLNEHAENVFTGEVCNLIRKKANVYNCYIVYNFHEFDDGEYYNTSALFGRNGEVCGRYRKTHLTVSELEQGISPGNGYPVFDTDFGKLGMLICYDHYFSSTTEELVKNGAEIIAVSSAGDANAKSIARAMDGGVWFAICGWNMENSYGWGPGRIISPDGTIVSHTFNTYEPANYEIDLNKKVRREWLSLGPAMSNIKAVYRYEKHNIE